MNFSEKENQGSSDISENSANLENNKENNTKILNENENEANLANSENGKKNLPILENKTSYLILNLGKEIEERKIPFHLLRFSNFR